MLFAQGVCEIRAGIQHTILASGLEERLFGTGTNTEKGNWGDRVNGKPLLQGAVRRAWLFSLAKQGLRI